MAIEVRGCLVACDNPQAHRCSPHSDMLKWTGQAHLGRLQRLCMQDGQGRTIDGIVQLRGSTHKRAQIMPKGRLDPANVPGICTARHACIPNLQWAALECKAWVASLPAATR